MLELLWKIVFLIKLLYIFYPILFYFVCYTHDVEVGYAIKVLCCNWTYYCLAGGTANFIIYYVIVTDVIVTRQDVIKPILLINVTMLDVIKPIFYLYFIMVHDVVESCGCQGVTRAIVLCGCYSSLNSGDLTNTLSQIYGSWYLPIFFIQGWVINSNIASFMSLAILWSLWKFRFLR